MKETYTTKELMRIAGITHQQVKELSRLYGIRGDVRDTRGRNGFLWSEKLVSKIQRMYMHKKFYDTILKDLRQNG